MATRTIVTAQPDVMCDVCERRLLRGEQPDVFLDAGRRRIVCELCAPRAAYEGWLRESDGQALGLAPMRPRRGRSLFARLRQATRPPAAAAGNGLVAEPSSEQAPLPYDVLADDPQPGDSHPSVPYQAHAPADALSPAEHADAASLATSAHAQAMSQTAPTPEPDVSYLHEALAVFNVSEFPRRVAGVARSLGEPSVTVRSAEHLSSVVSIVVAWELCWYRYQVDLSEPVVEAQMVDQGTELAELVREDRLANAAAAESGQLALATL